MNGHTVDGRTLKPSRHAVKSAAQMRRIGAKVIGDYGCKRRMSQLAVASSPTSIYARQNPNFEDLRLSTIKERLRAGLKYEAHNGACNFKGKQQVFSEFAISQCTEMLSLPNVDNEEKLRLNRVLKDMQKYAHQPAPKRVEILNQANQYLKGPLLCFGKPPSGTIYPDKYRVPPHLKPQNSLNPQYQGGLNIQRSVLKPSEPELNSEQAQVPKFKALQQYLYKATTETSQPSQNGAQVLNPSGAQPLQVPSQNLSSDQATRSPILTPPNLGDEAQRDTLSGNFGQAQQVGQDRGHDDLKDSLVSEETLEKMSEIDFKTRGHFKEEFTQFAKIFVANKGKNSMTEEMKKGEQRSAAWHALRENRLTASAFSTAIGFFGNRRIELWEEKLGLRPRFAGNAFTQWGNDHEDMALGRYTEVTGHTVTSQSFQIAGENAVLNWMGASPDGLIAEFDSKGWKLPFKAPPKAEGPGILEIKCPTARGDYHQARPPPQIPAYYMPQVQGLMEIFDREWANLYAWTIAGGSALYHVKRDRRYWADCYQALSEFWWCNIIPAKQVQAAGFPNEDLEPFRPIVAHPLTERIKERSYEIARNCSNVIYPNSRQFPSVE